MTVTEPAFFAIGVGFWLVALATLFFTTIGSGRNQNSLARRRPGVTEQPSILTRVTGKATTFVEQNVSRNSRSGSRDLLEQAGLKLRQSDFILLVACIAVTAGVVGFVLAGFFLG